MTAGGIPPSWPRSPRAWRWSPRPGRVTDTARFATAVVAAGVLTTAAAYLVVARDGTEGRSGARTQERPGATGAARRVPTVGPVPGPAAAGPTVPGGPAVPGAAAAGPTVLGGAGAVGAPGCTTAGIVAGWSLRRRAAAVVMVPVQSSQVEAAAADVAEGVGGLLLFGDRAPIDLHARLDALASVAPGPPPLVATDEEGGGIQRLANLVGDLPWARAMAARWSPAQVAERARQVGSAMRADGVTMDLAPVVDLDGGPGPDPRNADGQRSFSADAATASAYGLAFARGMTDAGVIPVLKHFPGHGRAHPSTDTGAASTPSIGELLASDLVPFTDGIRAGLPAVMVGGLTVPGVSAGPADLSVAAMTGLLREQLGFGGLIITDSLSQGAIGVTGTDVPTAAELAIEGGADMVEFGSGTATRPVIDRLVEAVTAGRLAPARLDQAVGRVLAVAHATPCRGAGNRAPSP